MPRNGANIYSKPAGTTAVASTTIESAKYNSVIDDLVADANTPRPVVAGGTGATSLAGLLAAIGGQPLDADLTAIAALGYTSGAYLLKKTAAGTFSLIALTAAGEALLDDADAAAQRTTLGLGALATAADVSTAEMDAGTLVTAADTLAANDNDTTIPTSAAVIDYVIASIPGAPSTSDVLTALAGASAGAVGTYTLAKRTSGAADVAHGSTLAGSSLSPASAIGERSGDSGNVVPTVGSALSGTWQCMGHLDYSAAGSSGGNTVQVTLWLRIS